jgi:hypothetical protein
MMNHEDDEWIASHTRFDLASLLRESGQQIAESAAQVKNNGVRRGDSMTKEEKDGLQDFANGWYAGNPESLRGLARSALADLEAAEKRGEELKLQLEGVCKRPGAAECAKLCMERDDLRQRAEAAEKERDHVRQWYAQRWERLKDLAKEHGIWDKAACIMANGTADSMEPPTYAQQLNEAKYRAEAAEAENAKLREERDRLRAALQNLLTDAGEGGRKGRAIDLLPKKTVDIARAALASGEPGK